MDGFLNQPRRMDSDAVFDASSTSPLHFDASGSPPRFLQEQRTGVFDPASPIPTAFAPTQAVVALWPGQSPPEQSRPATSPPRDETVVPTCGSSQEYYHDEEGGYELAGNERFYSEYEKYDELAQGDFGRVTAATCISDGQRYAVKQSKKVILGAKDEQHHLQEVYALSSLQSTAHVLRYFDAWIDNGHLHIATELLEHGNVRSLCPPPWPEPMLWNLALQVALGLHALHSSNVAHLDIKPDNLLYERDDSIGGFTVKIGDFGLARPLDTAATRQFVGINDDEGDARYLAPELLQSSSTPYLKEADMYALGMSLVDLAGGNYRRVRKADYSCLSTYSEHLRQLICRLTAPKPEERPTAFDVVREAGTKLHGDLFLPCDQRIDAQVQTRLDTIDALRRELEELETIAKEAGLAIPLSPSAIP
jgi:serine/threonine protein kinase